MVKKALVLSGGSILGAFQAGAIAHILETGFVPDGIYGTSVGSLNGAFLAERAGKAVRNGEEPDWPAIGQELERVWLEELDSPAKIGKQRSVPSLVWAIGRNRFEGLINTRPLRKMIEGLLDPDNLRLTPVRFSACSVNMATSEAVYASADYAGILDYIIASTAIPVLMPVSMIGKSPYVDGGVREVAPLNHTIEDKATEVTCIVCHPKKLSGACFPAGNLRDFAIRLMDVVTNELANNDLGRFDRVNEWVKESDAIRTEIAKALDATKMDGSVRDKVKGMLEELPVTGWRRIPIRVIQPKNEIVLDLMGFTRDEIAEVIKLGRNAAKEAEVKGE